MIIEDTDLDGVKLIKPTVHEDYRGTNFESYNASEYYKIPNQFVVDSISTSRKHVLRGIHGDHRTTKLISCLYGTIYFVVLDCRSGSKTFHQWYSAINLINTMNGLHNSHFVGMTTNLIFTGQSNIPFYRKEIDENSISNWRFRLFGFTLR